MSDNSDADLNDTQLDANDEDIFDEQSNQQDLLDYVDMSSHSAYLPCSAHHFQLVLKDGFKLDKTYEELLKRVTTMVGKSKKNSTVAEQLRALEKHLCKNNLTRWNSILFLVRSILKINAIELQQIRNNLPTKTKQQRATKELFRLTQIDREMLSELRDLLVCFEFVTNELQTNEISISRVYPCYWYLQKHLNTDLDKYKYTKNLRKELFSSLERRFSDLLVDNDIFILSTLLDPIFGKRRIPLELRDYAIVKLKNNLIKIATRSELPLTVSKISTKQTVETIRENNYLTFDDETSKTPIDDLDTQIKEYFLLIETQEFKDTLLFWKLYHKSHSFVNLAKLAQKVLGVPATSADVERMFSLSGHILGPKRRTTGVSLYEDLVYLKLNEQFLD